MEKEYKNEDKNKNKDKIKKCDCYKPRFQREEVKKECIDCMYKDILYLVP